MALGLRMGHGQIRPGDLMGPTTGSISPLLYIPVECNPITGRGHPKATPGNGIRTLGALDPVHGLHSLPLEAEGLSPKQSARGPLASPWVCFERGWCRGGRGADHHVLAKE